jgi:hypothetical protein
MSRPRIPDALATDIGDRGTHPSSVIRKHLDDHAVGCQPRIARLEGTGRSVHRDAQLHGDAQPVPSSSDQFFRNVPQGSR